MSKEIISKITVDCFYQEKTYGRLVIGVPTPKINDAMIEHSRLVAFKLYEEGNPIIIQPETTLRNGVAFLPYYVSFSCLSVYNTAGLWAHPVVIYFHDIVDMGPRGVWRIITEKVDFSGQKFDCLL